MGYLGNVARYGNELQRSSGIPNPDGTTLWFKFGEARSSQGRLASLANPGLEDGTPLVLGDSLHASPQSRHWLGQRFDDLIADGFLDELGFRKRVGELLGRGDFKIG